MGNDFSSFESITDFKDRCVTDLKKQKTDMGGDASDEFET